MQSHRVLWNVSLSSGENFRECFGKFEEFKGEPSPWQQLLVYLEESGSEITSMWLTCPGGARHQLPSMGIRDVPLLSAFHKAEKPTKLWHRRRLSAGPGLSGARDQYTIIEAIYSSYKLQIFVSEHDPNVSWSLVVPLEK